MARSNAAIDDPFSGRRRPDSGHRPCDPLQAVGRVGAAYPRLRARTHSDLPALVPTNRQPQRAQRLGATSRQRWPLPVLASWRPGRRVWCGPLSLGIARRAVPRGRAAFSCCARAKVLALLAIPKLLRDVPAAEAWPPSSELRQMAPRMIVPVAPPRGLSLRDPPRPPRLVACPFEIPRVPRGLLLVPSRSFASPSGVLLVPSRSFRVQRCGHDLSRVFPFALVAVVRSSGLLSRVRRVA